MYPVSNSIEPGVDIFTTHALSGTSTQSSYSSTESSSCASSLDASDDDDSSGDRVLCPFCSYGETTGETAR